MHCKRCGRKLTSMASVKRGVGATCQKRLLAAKERYKPTELFDIAECTAKEVKAACETVEPVQAARVRRPGTQIGLNFEPKIDRAMSMIEQHRIAERILNKREV